uniref:C-type lectin domain containing 6A n=1 Tax=Equus asinus asinus TaxID=83772 RepID=A0A8C4PQY8_EQUAS
VVPTEAPKAAWWFQVRLWSVALISIVPLLLIPFTFISLEFYVYITSFFAPVYLILHFSLSCNLEKVWGCCPSTWKPFGSSCYFVSTEQNFWTKSEQNCVGMGAHLVVINTEAEQNFIIQQLNESLSYFLGLSDPQGNGNWQWIDKTPYKENVRLWHQNEPNFSAEECASIVFWNQRGWGWNDVFCDSSRHSICEMKKIYL